MTSYLNSCAEPPSLAEKFQMLFPDELVKIFIEVGMIDYAYS